MLDWYTQAEMATDVTRISESHVNELLSANFWWLHGTDRDIVIDAGLGVVALCTLVRIRASCSATRPGMQTSPETPEHATSTR
jgi:hypothetical protein